MAQRYGWTFEQIAHMTFEQQLAAVSGSPTVEFSSEAEFMRWLQRQA